MLTLGRLPKALDIAEAMSKAGCRVIIAEPAAWHLCRVSRYVAKSIQVPSPNDHQQAYVDALLRIIKDEQVSIVVPVSEEALHASLIDTALPQGVRLFAPPHQQMRELHDKNRFCALAKNLGLAVPETFLLGSQAAEQFAQANNYILKPSCTCSGQGFSAHTKGEKLPDANTLPQTLVQSKMTGALKSTFSICHEGRVIGTVVYRASILSGTVAIAFERLDQEQAIQSWIETFVRATQYSGFIAFDMMEDDHGVPHAIECNPRATSGIHFINREDIAGAILDPKSQTSLRMRDYPVMYQFWPALTETQMALFNRDQFGEKVRTMWAAKEVNFSWSDPLPLWLMPFTSWQIMKRAFINGESFGEASTHDIAWFESPPSNETLPKEAEA